MQAVAAHIAQILVAALGGLGFHLLGVPAAWLSGAVVAIIVWGLLGHGRPLPRPLVDAALLISGVIMGAGVTPEAIAALARYPASLAVLAVAVVAISGTSMLWLTRVSGWDREDAILASVPGALSTVFALALDRDGDIPSIAVVQLLRLFILITLLPQVVTLLGGAGPVPPLGQGLPVVAPEGLALLLCGALVLALVFERLRLAAPMLLGGAVVSSALHATDAAPGVVPPVIATGGLVLIGIFLAERFRILKWTALKRTMPAAMGSFAIGTAVAAAFAGVAALLARVGFSDALVAFAPGGLEAMMVLSLILGLDPLYVGIHHIARVLGITFGLPPLLAWLRRGG